MSQKRGKMPDHMRREAEQQRPGMGSSTGGSEERERSAGGKHVPGSGGNGGPMRKERDTSNDPNRNR